MRIRYLIASVGMAFVLAGCNKHEAADSHSAPVAARTVAATTANAPARESAAQQKTVEQPSDVPSKITRINEDGSETVEDVTSDSGAHNPLLAAVASTVAASTSTAFAAPVNGSTSWQEGVNYTRLVPAQPTAVPTGQVEVLEFFWYACPHCNAIDPLVAAWLKTKPNYVTFSRVHVLWSESHRSLARLYYTLESMGKLDQLHSEIFKAIHVDGNPLVGADPTNAAQSERIQTTFVVKHGISEAEFTKTYHSMSVDLALQRADELVQRYRVDSVPKFVVNGKYVADKATAGSEERLISLVGDLAAQEHKR
jgi:protein dithiol oxidoreductase (disulfide-forming)